MATEVIRSSTSGEVKRRHGTRERPSLREMLTAWIWIGPAVLFVAIFLVYPVIYTIWLSF